MGSRALAAFGLRFLLPVLAALVVGGLLLLAFGADPIGYYATVVERGLLSPIGLQASVTRSAPLLLIAAGLIVAFRAGLWNLGADGQFLLAAVFVAAVAPPLAGRVPHWLMLPAAFAVGAAVAALWSLVPALLKALEGVNEIVSTLMASFLGVSLANVLIKLPFNDPTTTVPQTATLAVDQRLARFPGTTVHWGVLLGLVAVIAVHLLLERTAFGLRLRVLGENPRAARHVGLPVRRLTVAAFALSAGLIGLAGAVEVLGVQGSLRADWNPAYGLLVVPLVFLARLNGWATIATVLFFAVLMIGGESAARRTGVPTYYLLVQVALMLLAFAAVRAVEARRGRG